MQGGCFTMDITTQDRRSALRLPNWDNLLNVANAAVRVGIFRTLYLRLRFGGWCVILRGTRLRLGSGARIEVAPGSRFLLGTRHIAATDCSVHLGPHARLAVHGTAEIFRGTRILLGSDARLEIGQDSFISYNSSHGTPPSSTPIRTRSLSTGIRVPGRSPSSSATACGLVPALSCCPGCISVTGLS
jgi:hypothetical protein